MISRTAPRHVTAIGPGHVLTGVQRYEALFATLHPLDSWRETFITMDRINVRGSPLRAADPRQRNHASEPNREGCYPGGPGRRNVRSDSTARAPLRALV